MSELRIGYLSTLYHTSILIKGLGWLEDEGIESKWRLFGTGPAIIEAFTKGQLDIGYIGLAPTIIGLGKGAKVRCIAGGHVEGSVIVGRQGYKSDAEFGGDVGRALGQFKGKRVGTPRHGSLHDVFLRYYLSKHGLSRDIEVVNYDWADFIPEAMSNGDVDGACGTPPLSVLLRNMFGAEIVVSPKMIWPNNPSYGIVTSVSMLEGSKQALGTFLRLHKRACKMIRKQPEEAAEAVSKSVELVDQKFALDTYAVSPKYCAALSKEYIDSTLDLVPTLKDLGYLSRQLAERDIFDPSLIQMIHPEAPHYLFG